MKKLLSIILVLLIITGCKRKEETVNDVREKGIPVTVAEVRKGSGDKSLNYSGSIEASQTIPLFFQTTGTVEKVLVETGDAVEKGQLLATLDQSDLKNISDMTEVKYKQAKDAYDRLKKVYEQGSLPEIKWVEMETNLEQAKSSMELAKNNLDKCFLRSPSDGIIGKRSIEPGMIPLTMGSAPFELVDINTVNVKISVPENEIGRIKKGMNAKITVAALDSRQYEGRISRVSPVADKLSRTYEAKIEVSNPGYALKPGMICDVYLSISNESGVLLVPYQSVLRDQSGETFVFILDTAARQVEKRRVQTGRFIDNSLEIREGLTPGQWVVKEGKEKLSDKTLVRISHE